MISETLTFFKTKADRIEDWQKINKNTLLNLYIKHEHDDLADNYLSAIICRYWSNIYNYYQKNSNFELDEYCAWYIEAIMKALEYRSWLDKTKPISKDKSGPDKTVNRCIKTVIGNHYYLSGMDKRKINTDEGNKLPLDKLIEDSNGSLHDIIPSLISNTGINYCGELVQQYINKKDYMTALTLDIICFQDSFKGNKFNARKVVSQLTDINESYTNYFISSYDNVSKRELNKVYKYIDSITMPVKKNNNILYKAIDNIIGKLKTDKSIKELVCC